MLSTTAEMDECRRLAFLTSSDNGKGYPRLSFSTQNDTAGMTVTQKINKPIIMTKK